MEELPKRKGELRKYNHNRKLSSIYRRQQLKEIRNIKSEIKEYSIIKEIINQDEIINSNKNKIRVLKSKRNLRLAKKHLKELNEKYFEYIKKYNILNICYYKFSSKKYYLKEKIKMEKEIKVIKDEIDTAIKNLEEAKQERIEALKISI